MAFSLCASEAVALDRAAEMLLDLSARHPSTSRSLLLAEATRRAHMHYAWPVAWVAEGFARVSDAEAQASQWMRAQSFPAGQVRCGFVLRAQTQGTFEAATIAVAALAEMDPLPTEVRTGQWLTVRALALVPASGARVYVREPNGESHPLLVSYKFPYIVARLAAKAPGTHHIQVVLDVEGGPRPVLEQTFDADGISSRRDWELGASQGSALWQEVDVIAALDALRAEHGAGPLRVSPRLGRAASLHAQAMKSHRRVAHDLGTGRIGERLHRLGVPFRVAVENLAHANTLEDAHRSLAESPAHRSAMLDRRFRSLGLGIADDEDGTVWLVEVYAQ